MVVLHKMDETLDKRFLLGAQINFLLLLVCFINGRSASLQFVAQFDPASSFPLLDQLNPAVSCFRIF